MCEPWEDEVEGECVSPEQFCFEENYIEVDGECVYNGPY